VIFDGDCNFCSLWVRRWQAATAQQVDYLPSQDPQIAARFPELPREQLETAVQLIEPDGSVYGGAEAVFRVLAHKPHEHWLRDWYYRSTVFAQTTEWAYRLVARHRGLFSVLTRLAWGRHVERPSYLLVRWAFLRSLGIIYLIAFVSLWTQIIGLVGSEGVLPARSSMAIIRQQADAHAVGLERYHLVPTLCWFSTSDRFLKLQCAAGTVLATLLIVGIAPAPCLFLLWLIYLSLCTVCREFLAFQWDILLLQTGFLAIFLAPLQILPRLSQAAPPSRLVLWLLRWLLFQLMFESGCVKLASGDPTWRHLTALRFHYETQPLPTWIGWCAFQLPPWFQTCSAVVMFVVELLVPFLIFAPRRLRHFACIIFVLFQTLILLTGNYCFFNLLTIALCLLLLDDHGLKSLVPSSLRSLASFNPQLAALNRLKWPPQVTVPLACVSLGISLMYLGRLSGARLPWPRPFFAAYEWLAPFRTFNSYGLFAVMTTTRREIIIEGSRDGVNWQAYDFRYKPGDVTRRPRFVEPHQPRLDWQMWFAALSEARQNPWLVNTCVRLLQDSPSVLALLAYNPFPAAPPQYVRAVLYDYHFTDLATRRRTGAWWRREKAGNYLPAMTLGKPPTSAASPIPPFDKRS
jgi:lipase maturation factor 1